MATTELEETKSSPMETTLFDLLRHSPDSPDPDVKIITSTGHCIPAHSKILASASSVLEKIIAAGPRKHMINSVKIIPILGVPYGAVSAFIRFLHSSRCREEEEIWKKYGIHLLALSHVYMIRKLKQRCINAIGKQLTAGNVVDVLQLARLCDAPDLYLKSMKFVSNNFKAVENTESWNFLQYHDPWLELEILQLIHETESRETRWRRHREDRKVYSQLVEGLDCLEHICREGCTSVGPYDMEPQSRKSKGPCNKFTTCEGIQLLIRHFVACKKRVNGGCMRCKRMWQLLRLHSSTCDKIGSCRVPLCRQFKLKMQEANKGDDARWRLLVKKVVSSKTISELSEKRRIKGNNGQSRN